MSIGFMKYSSEEKKRGKGEWRRRAREDMGRIWKEGRERGRGWRGEREERVKEKRW